MCDMCPKLTMRQRIAGYVAASGLGFLVAICGSLTLADGYTDENVLKFAMLYICGNMIALAASAFFKGPKKLHKAATHKTRRVGCAVWLGLMVSIFGLALLRCPVGIIVILLVLETGAGVWFSASFIPWGRKMIITFCQRSFFLHCPEALEPIAKKV